MKKTIFKGTVNGKEFDSVQKYNEEILKLQSEGKDFTASSHTECVECGCECVECGRDCECECDCECNCEQETVVLPMPGFDQPNTNYMDVEYTEEEWEAMQKDVSNEINKMSKNALAEYLAIVEGILSNLDNDVDSFEKAYGELQKKFNDAKLAMEKLREYIDEVQSKMNTLKKCNKITEKYGGFYESAYNQICNALDRYDESIGQAEPQTNSNDNFFEKLSKAIDEDFRNLMDKYLQF